MSKRNTIRGKVLKKRKIITKKVGITQKEIQHYYYTKTLFKKKEKKI